MVTDEWVVTDEEWVVTDEEWVVTEVLDLNAT